jgi:hypothetical protein
MMILLQLSCEISGSQDIKDSIIITVLWDMTPCSVKDSLQLREYKHQVFRNVGIKKLRGFSPQASYTDRPTASCRQCQRLRIEDVAWSVQWVLMAVLSDF